MIEQSRTFRRLTKIAARHGMKIMAYASKGGVTGEGNRAQWCAYTDNGQEQSMPTGKAEELRHILNEMKVSK